MARSEPWRSKSACSSANEDRPRSSRITASPSITADRTFSAPAAVAIAGNLAVQSWPLRVRIVASPSETYAETRYPSHFISCTHCGPTGGLSTSVGRTRPDPFSVAARRTGQPGEDRPASRLRRDRRRHRSARRSSEALGAGARGGFGIALLVLSKTFHRVEPVRRRSWPACGLLKDAKRSAHLSRKIEQGRKRLAHPTPEMLMRIRKAEVAMATHGAGPTFDRYHSTENVRGRLRARKSSDHGYQSLAPTLGVAGTIYGSTPSRLEYQPA